MISHHVNGKSNTFDLEVSNAALYPVIDVRAGLTVGRTSRFVMSYDAATNVAFQLLLEPLGFENTELKPHSHP